MNLAINFGTEKIFDFKVKTIKNIIIDRKSKYTSVGGNVKNKEAIKFFLKK
ncbi:hypothetical protein LR002_00600 [Candidatus Gracilibacteria bacterium]|nr:hypothetical protein [Candidatus Gracilibacteria bacterium]